MMLSKEFQDLIDHVDCNLQNCSHKCRNKYDNESDTIGLESSKNLYFYYRFLPLDH